MTKLDKTKPRLHCGNCHESKNVASEHSYDNHVLLGLISGKYIGPICDECYLEIKAKIDSGLTPRLATLCPKTLRYEEQ